MSTVAPRPHHVGRPPGKARAHILDAAVQLIRRQGLSATSVDQICSAAGVTKGAFFHHFPSKEALAIAAADHWSSTTGALFAAADYHRADGPAERVLGYLDLRERLVAGPPEQFTCLAGTMAQEVFAADPDVRAACGNSILGHAATLQDDIAEALAAGGVHDLDPASLARFTQVVLQGAFVVAKAADDPTVVNDAIAHLRRYFTSLFAGERSRPARRPAHASLKRKAPN